MDTYLEKVTLTVTSSSGVVRHGVATSTKAFSGYIHGVYQTTFGTPLSAGSSSYWQLKADSTAGRILCRSSSGSIGSRYYFPKHAFHYSTAGTQYGLDGMRIPVVREKITLIKICGATTAGGGKDEGVQLVVFIEGVHP